MAVSAHCTSVVVNANGRIYVNFANGDQREFESLAEMQSVAATADAPAKVEDAENMLLRWWLAQDPDAADLSIVTGRQLTFDLTASPSPMFIQNLGG